MGAGSGATLAGCTQSPWSDDKGAAGRLPPGVQVQEVCWLDTLGPLAARQALGRLWMSGDLSWPGKERSGTAGPCALPLGGAKHQGSAPQTRAVW